MVGQLYIFIKNYWIVHLSEFYKYTSLKLWRGGATIHGYLDPYLSASLDEHMAS